MILIVSDAEDKSTDQVIDWLHYHGKRIIRINTKDKIFIHEASPGSPPSIVFSVNNSGKIRSSDIKSYWYRRGTKKEFITKYNPPVFLKPELKKLLSAYLQDMSITLTDFLFFIFQCTEKRIGNIDNAINNKLIHLSIAQQIGICIPSSRICSSKSSLKKFRRDKSIISKTAADGFFYEENDTRTQTSGTYGLYANRIEKADLEKIPDRFFPSLIQENIPKKFELRIFYLKGEFYSMAIFSQRNKRTAIDFRKYDEDQPNYTVPFKLPFSVKSKLKKFMLAAGLDTGSIDMIYGEDGNYYFLEVNPAGQFEMVSYPCNYSLEKIIATALL